ncbi:MAG: glycosyltransferase family 9 protein [Planctomycetes bacterium]|nr:glycosyltransferase family 9 protein [Planctomycetota bacterium]NUQ33509.1 glycosyltransferase family 9 protein [Planctomycetaceae bacterium]
MSDTLSTNGSLLIVKPSALGDVAQAVGVARAIKTVRPDVRIGWLVNREFAGLLRPLSFISRVHEFDRRGLAGVRGLGRLYTLIRELSAVRYDAVLDMQGLLRSGVLAWLSGAGKRIGFSDAREGASFFYTDRVQPSPGAVHSVERMCALLPALGVDAEQDEQNGHFEVSYDENARVRRLLGTDVSPIVLCPGAQWKSKMWPVEHWAALASKLREATDAPIVLIASEAERELTARIADFCSVPLLDLGGKTSLRELVALFSIARLVVSNDSGPMHLASAQGTPLIALFGPTDPSRTGPWGSGSLVIRAPNAPDDHRAYRRISDDRVMRRISVESVLVAAHNRLSEGHPVA